MNSTAWVTTVSSFENQVCYSFDNFNLFEFDTVAHNLTKMQDKNFLAIPHQKAIPSVTITTVEDDISMDMSTSVPSSGPGGSSVYLGLR